MLQPSEHGQSKASFASRLRCTSNRTLSGILRVLYPRLWRVSFVPRTARATVPCAESDALFFEVKGALEGLLAKQRAWRCGCASNLTHEIHRWLPEESSTREEVWSYPVAAQTTCLPAFDSVVVHYIANCGGILNGSTCCRNHQAVGLRHRGASTTGHSESESNHHDHSPDPAQRSGKPVPPPIQ